MSFPFTPDSDFLDTPRPQNSQLAISALARFEFEAGKANDGTKILMIEWHDDDLPIQPSTAGPGSWHVSWEGKQAVLPADERTSDNTRRVYFLLPPHATIPPVVTLSYAAHPTNTPDTTKTTSATTDNAIQLNPLPAIFPPELGATGRAAGKKGVLHTIWAKKRLQSLEQEIREECRHNVEGIALHMALQEKEWIETNFGLDNNSNSNNAAPVHDPSYPMGPATPVSPTSGGKLGEKLKGLKLQTGLSTEGQSHFLSPQSPDMAVSSFTSFHRVVAPPAAQNDTPDQVRTVAHYPPQALQAQQETAQAGSGFASMSGMARTSSADSGEELFAKALSPRSPDLPRSPFSFAPEALK
ncbi:hypothetical protein HFD88_006152 [Aspergillus terreus]|nr:hypothetical protein HFD88_006152 [Aspergillus terreus]